MQPLSNPVNVDGKPLVVLRGIEHGNVFYSMSHLKGEDPTKLMTGEVAYEVLAYCDTDEEAQKILRQADPGTASLCDIFERAINKGDSETAIRAACALKPDLVSALEAMDFLDKVACVYREGCKDPNRCAAEGYCLQLK